MGSKSIRKFKKKNKGLTLEQQESLMQDLTDMIVLVLAHQKYVKSIGKEEESKAFIKKFVDEARDEALEDVKKKVSQ